MADDTETKNGGNKESEEYSSNAISVNDFEKLENKETKKSVSGMFNKLIKKDKNDNPEKHDVTHHDDSEMGQLRETIDNMTIKTDKIEGKLEIMTALEKDKDEEILKLTEEIGELRSMIFDREKSFNDVMTKFEKIKDATEEIKPEKIKKNMDRKEKDILGLEAKLELETERNNKFEKKIEKINKVYDNIKSIESLTNITKYIDKQIKKIKDQKEYVNRTTAKVEQIFFELNKKQEALDNINEMIQDNKELMEDNVRAIDTLELKFDNTMQKKDLESIKKGLNVRLDMTDEKMYKIKDVITALIEKTTDNHTTLSTLQKIPDNINTTLDDNKELLKDNAKTIDALEMRIENTIGTKDIEKIKKELNMRVDKNKNDLLNITALMDQLIEKTTVNHTKLNDLQKVPMNIKTIFEDNKEMFKKQLETNNDKTENKIKQIKDVLNMLVEENSLTKSTTKIVQNQNNFDGAITKMDNNPNSIIKETSSNEIAVPKEIKTKDKQTVDPLDSLISDYDSNIKIKLQENN
ncbi:MAG: hypothetical protein GQ477_05080 [Nanohaloarchaea archaeon]|nr:hypothetical protein [Candidatus Nanohaloarchaea archaeon]